MDPTYGHREILEAVRDGTVQKIPAGWRSHFEYQGTDVSYIIRNLDDHALVDATFSDTLQITGRGLKLLEVLQPGEQFTPPYYKKRRR